MSSERRIYLARGMDGYELCHPIRQQDFERLNAEINGASRESSWRSVPVRLIHNDEGRDLVHSDSPWLGPHALIFRSTVVDAMAPLLRLHGELLPLECSEAELVAYNPTRVLDALDEAGSSLLRFREGGIMMIQRYVFRADMVGESDIFKIPSLRVSPVFLSQEFVDRWRENGLRGLSFEQVWSHPS